MFTVGWIKGMIFQFLVVKSKFSFLQLFLPDDGFTKVRLKNNQIFLSLSLILQNDYLFVVV